MYAVIIKDLTDDFSHAGEKSKQYIFKIQQKAILYKKKAFYQNSFENNIEILIFLHNSNPLFIGKYLFRKLVDSKNLNDPLQYLTLCPFRYCECFNDKI